MKIVGKPRADSTMVSILQSRMKYANSGRVIREKLQAKKQMIPAE